MARGWGRADIPDLTGSVAVVTGGNSGLGLETVRALASKGAQVVLTSRDVAKGEKARASLGALPGAVEVMRLDLADLASVRAFAGQVRERHTRLDLLINNAGVMMTPPGVTADGFELQFGTNHLGHFALTGLLWPALEQRPGSRVVTVSSLAHRAGAVSTSSPDAPGADYSRFGAYGAAKMANLLFAYDLHRRLTARALPVLSLAAHPGVSATPLGEHLVAGRAGWLLRPLYRVFTKALTQSPRTGALPSVRAATDPSAVGGQFYGPRRLGQQRGAPVVVRSNAASHDVAAAERLWAQSEELTGVSFLSD